METYCSGKQLKREGAWGTAGHSQSASGSGILELQSHGSQGGAEGEALLEVGRVLTLPRETWAEGTCGSAEMSFRSSRVVLILLSALFLLHQTTKVVFCYRTNRQEIGKSLFWGATTFSLVFAKPQACGEYLRALWHVLFDSHSKKRNIKSLKKKALNWTFPKGNLCPLSSCLEVGESALLCLPGVR